MTVPEQTDGQLTKSFLSYRLLRDVLQSANLSEDEEAVIVTRMNVDPSRIDEFERLLRMILKNTHTIGHISTCVVKPHPGDTTYTSVVKYASLRAMKQVFPGTVDSGVDFYKLLAARDSLLVEPPTYQIEAGFGTWIESDGQTKPMRGDDPEEDTNPVFQEVPGACCNDSCDNPHGLNVQASFVVPSKNFKLFREKYQRNNKKGGQKNVRCFPCCRNGRHVTSGFCGDSIRVHVAISRITEFGGVKICPIQTNNHHPAVVAYARFINLDGAFDPTVSGPEVLGGQTITKEEVMSFVRDKERPMNPLIPGVLRGASVETSQQSAIFEFNTECKAWHYGWTAPRGQGLSGSDAQHVLEIIFMKPLGQYMFCLERLRSDSFSIYSSRRASHATIKPEPEAFENGEAEQARSYKRKRGHTPTSPMDTTASIGTTSPGAFPVAEDSWDGQATPHASGVSVAPAPEDKELNEASFMLQGTCLSNDMPMNHSHQHSHTLHQQLNQLIANQHATSYFGNSMVPQQPVSHIIGAPVGYHTQQQQQQQHHFGVRTSAPMGSHEIHENPRVMSTDEIRWSELYNLFDPM